MLLLSLEKEISFYNHCNSFILEYLLWIQVWRGLEKSRVVHIFHFHISPLQLLLGGSPRRPFKSPLGPSQVPPRQSSHRRTQNNFISNCHYLSTGNTFRAHHEIISNKSIGLVLIESLLRVEFSREKQEPSLTNKICWRDTRSKTANANITQFFYGQGVCLWTWRTLYFPSQ